MNKKKNGKRIHNNSIRYTIFTYFTVTALAASLLITFSIYQRLSSQVSETVMEENQSLIGQVARSVESYLRTVMKLSDSLYYGAVKLSLIHILQAVRGRERRHLRKHLQQAGPRRE